MFKLGSLQMQEEMMPQSTLFVPNIFEIRKYSTFLIDISNYWATLIFSFFSPLVHTSFSHMINIKVATQGHLLILLDITYGHGTWERIKLRKNLKNVMNFSFAKFFEININIDRNCFYREKYFRSLTCAN